MLTKNLFAAWPRMVAGVALAMLSMAPEPSPAVTPGVIPAPPNTSEVYAVIERGRLALVAEKYADASKAMDEALEKPEFAALPRSDQFRAFLFAAYAAQGREDYLGAHEFWAIATRYPEANQDTWLMRARTAYWVDAYADAGAALTTVAQKWPKSLEDFDKQTVSHVVRKMGEDKKLAAEKLELLNALFAGKYTGKWNSEPSDMWRELVLQAVERNDIKRAREVMKRVTDPTTLVVMRTDRRYDALLQADPRAFDVAAAAQAECKRWQRVADSNPRQLGPLVQYMYSLITVGRYADVVTLADRTLARQAKGTHEKPAFEDEEDQLNWIVDLKSQGLYGLGRFDEALAVRQKAGAMRETSSDKVSQAINLGFTYTLHNQPAEALKALEGIDWAKSLSGYGRMQLQHVRLRAYLEQGNRAEAEKVFVYLRENKDDAEDTWQTAMLDWGDLEGAAAQYIARLKDPNDRPQALYSAQTFSDHPRMAREIEERAKWQSVLERPDVTAAIAEVGRRENQPIHDLYD